MIDMQFSVGSIPVRVQPLFLVLIFIIAWLSTQSLPLMLIWAFVIFISVLIHELGHAITAKKYGQQVLIELFGMGGLTYRHGPQLKKWQDFIIVFNGPLAGFCLASFAYLFVKGFGAAIPNLLAYVFVVVFNVNVFWTIINLLPVYPLDGGHLLRIFFEGIMGFRGTQLAFLLSSICGLGLSFLFFMRNFWIAGALFFMFTFESFRQFQRVWQMSGHDQNQNLQALYKNAQAAQLAGQDEQALKIYLELREKTQKGVLFLTSTESAAQVLTQLGRFHQAYDLLRSVSGRLSGNGIKLLHQLAYELGYWQEAIQFGTQIFHLQPDYQIAVANSICHAILGEKEQAVGWFRAALDQGLPNPKEILQKREFDAIRGLDFIQNILNA